MGTKASVKGWAANKFASTLGRRGLALTRPRFHEEQSIDLRALLAEPIEWREGNFVVLQIGANDGVTNDPLHDAVVARAWDLYAVEPVPATFARLQENYAGNPRVRYLQCAVGTANGETPLYTIRQDAAVGGFPYDQFASFSKEVIRQRWRYIPDINDRIETITVATMTLDSLIEKYEIPRVDMLQIDTEGFDYEIVKMAFESGIVPPILAFEWVHLGQQDMWDCRCDLIDHGYRWLINKGDVIAARES